MTGFRIGYLAASEKVIKALKCMQSHLTGNACTFAQHGCLAAFDLGEEYYAKVREIMQRKRNLAYELANGFSSCKKPKGAFYLFLDMTEHIEKLNMNSADELVEHLLKNNNVAVVPGSAFGIDKYIRISYATDEESIKEGFKRIKEGLIFDK